MKETMSVAMERFIRLKVMSIFSENKADAA